MDASMQASQKFSVKGQEQGALKANLFLVHQGH